MTINTDILIKGTYFMTPTWLSLLPPLIVVITAFITKKLNPSLLLGIISAAIIATDGSLSNSLLLIQKRFSNHLHDLDAIYLYIFLLAIGTLIALLNYTGGAIAFAQSFTARIKRKKTVESSSILLSYILGIDDYLSILTNGYVMSPVFDHLKITRLKLAFLIHSLAGAFVILVPISSWVAAITVYLDQSGIGLDQHAQDIKIAADPFFIYLHTLPFIFYSLLLMAAVWLIVQARLSYGPMYKYEHGTYHEPIATRQTTPVLTTPRGTSADLLIPLFTLLACVFIGLPYAGGHYIFGGTRTLIEAFQHNDYTFLVMCISGTIALLVGLTFTLLKSTVHLHELPHIFKNGFNLMRSAILMVILASVLGVLLRADLFTGQYLASLLMNTLSITMLPVTFFLVSLICAIFTGSAWGTFALMLSIAIPMLTSLLQLATPVTPDLMPILFPTIGAIFSGGVCGDHISPISETTVMTASSTGTNPIDHAYTQFPYALPVIIGTIIAFIASGNLIHIPLWMNALISSLVGIIVCFSLLSIFNVYWHTNKKD